MRRRWYGFVRFEYAKIITQTMRSDPLALAFCAKTAAGRVGWPGGFE